MSGAQKRPGVESIASGFASAVERAEKAAHDFPRAAGRTIEITARSEGGAPVTISARLEDGGVRAEITAFDPSTRASLLQHLDDMRHHLGRLGVAVSSLEVRFDDTSRHRGRRDRGDEERASRPAEVRRGSRAVGAARRPMEGVDYVA